MDDRDREHLAGLVAHARKAIDYAAAEGDDWWSDEKTLDAVIARLTQVGEAAARTSPQSLVTIGGITWPAIRGLRNRIVHDYAGVDVELIRITVAEDLPVLIDAVEEALSTR